MRCLRRDLWIACFLILAGCDSRDGDRTGERKSFQALAQAYKQAHAHKDVEALLELVYVGSGPLAEVNTREFRARFTNDLQQDLKGIRRKRLTRDDRDAFRHPNLKPRGKLWIEWIPRDELTVKSFQGYRYGKHKGIYYIVATGPGAIEEELTD